MQWLEYPNVAVTVAGKNITRENLLAIVNGLREIDDHRWVELGAAVPH